MKISLIIPAYNEEKGILQALEQFKDVHDDDFEIIVSDNGSTDKTREKAYQVADAVIHLPSDKRSTIGECRNRGARAASGDILWFIDADVRIPKIKQILFEIRDLFKDNKNIVAATIPITIYPEDVKFWDKFWFGFTNMMTYLQNRITKTGGAPGDCQIIRSSTFQKLEGFNPIMATSEDHELFQRLAKQGEIQVFSKYYIEMSARRIHRDGWPKILWQWGRNWFNQFILHKVDKGEWEARR
ncbi:MAG: glycosyltransferase [bacterium]|nr:glycosyltransferase [bacterium]